MLHDVALDDDIADTKHIFRQRKIYFFMAHRILHLAKTKRGSRDARALRARRDYKLASRELFTRLLCSDLKFIVSSKYVQLG